MPEKKLERISSVRFAASWDFACAPAGIPSPSAYQGGCGADHLIGISGRLEAFHQVAAWCREGGEGQ